MIYDEFMTRCRWCGQEHYTPAQTDICEEHCLSMLETHVEPAKQEIVIEVTLQS